MKMSGCNKTMMAKPSGMNSSRMSPSSFARNNMSKGGVNDKHMMMKTDMKSAGMGKRK